MVKYNQLTGVQKKYAKFLRVYFVTSIILLLSGLSVLVLSLTLLKDNEDVMVISIQLLTAGLLIGGWTTYIRFNKTALKKRAIKEYDERISEIRLQTINLSYSLSGIVLLITVLVFTYLEPVVSVLLMFALLVFGLIHFISYLIVSHKYHTDKE